MEPLVMRFVSAFPGAGHSPGDLRRVHIVVPRSRAYLADLLAKAFEGREGVEIIVDRRSRDRRMQQLPVGAERRRAQRRRSQERSEEHTSELQSRLHLVCRLLLEKKKQMSVR